MNIPHEVINICGVLVGQILHIVKKKTEENSGEPESSIFVKWVLRRPINTIGAALVGVGASLGLTSGEVAQAMGPVVVFLQAVVAGIAANSSINRAGENGQGKEGRPQG